MKFALAFAAAVLCAGCLSARSDKAVAADAGASWTYHDARYERLCVEVEDAPAACDKYRAALDELLWQWATANTVQQVGSMPAEEKKAVASAMAAARDAMP